VIRVRGLREWVAANVKGDNPYAVATSLIQRATPAGLKRLLYRFRRKLPFDPRTLSFGVGRLGGKPHGYLGRHVLDLGDRHAHAIVDVPWNKLKVALGSKVRAAFDPWRKYAIKRLSAELLAIRNPRPTDGGDRAIVEAAVHVPRGIYNELRRSVEFEILPDGVLARRGRRKKATNIFVVPK
jgi:hypothetical protein